MSYTNHTRFFFIFQYKLVNLYKFLQKSFFICYNEPSNACACTKQHTKTDLEDYKGKWHTFFENDYPLHIEIGMGKGKFIHTLAEQNPEVNYIGIELYSSVLYRAIEKRQEKDISNLYFIRMDAKNLLDVFAPGEIQRIYLNFSDPWPKERHAKRRLTSPVFLSLYNEILSTEGVICFKTDNRTLFDYSVETIGETSPWKLKDITYDLHHSEFAQNNIMTEYEEKFSAKGFPIHRLVAYR